MKNQLEVIKSTDWNKKKWENIDFKGLIINLVNIFFKFLLLIINDYNFF
jgi:hypothetical protein